MLQKMERDNEDILTLTGTAIKELKEEADIYINPRELTYICDYWPSVGGTREKITCYHVEYPGLVDLVKSSKNNTFGLLEEG